MKRIILHWTAGGYTPSKSDLQHYHFVVDGDGVVINGALPAEANKAPIGKVYAAHTLNCNSDSIGIAVAAMAGAKERPFDAGKAPIKEVQLEALARLCAGLCKQYGILVTRETVLTHAEVQPTLGIKQRGKWDIAWLPHLTGPIDPVAAGDMLRARVSYAMQPKARPSPMPQPVSKPLTQSPALPLSGLWAILRKILGGSK